MNSTFVIEPKYDNGVGFLVLDNTRKLVFLVANQIRLLWLNGNKK